MTQNYVRNNVQSRLLKYAHLHKQDVAHTKIIPQQNLRQLKFLENDKYGSFLFALYVLFINQHFINIKNKNNHTNCKKHDRHY